MVELIDWADIGFVDPAVIDEEPPTTGSRQWDAFIAGVAETIALQHGRKVPGWASSPGRILDAPWFVTPYGSLWPEVLRTTPPPFHSRGVLFSRASLGTV